MEEITIIEKHNNKYARLKEIENHIVHMKDDKKKNAISSSSPSRWLVASGAVLLAVALTTCAIARIYKVDFISDSRLNQQSILQMHSDKATRHADRNLSANNARAHDTTGVDRGKVVSCYYNFPSQHESSQLMPSDIHPYLCTHINVCFGSIQNKEIKLDDYQYKTLRDIVKLKQKNPQLKILLSVGGGGNDGGFSDMVVNHASRKIFIKSIKNILRNYTLDGIDLDWEFPAIHRMAVAGRERQHFSQLLREIRMEYNREKKDYILTLAVAAPQTIVDVSYDIDQLNEYADYVNIMTYDYHFYTKYTPFTGLNSPVYARPTESMYLATLNINYTMNMYISKGLSRDKIVVGIPTYGHTFSLVNANNARVGSPASGIGSLGTSGFINYPDVCLFLKNFNSDVTVKHDEYAKVPYLYRGKDWISYDTPQSVIDKANFIKDNELRGAMIYSLNADDYEGVCASEPGGDTKFPLLRSVKNTLLFNKKEY